MQLPKEVKKPWNYSIKENTDMTMKKALSFTLLLATLILGAVAYGCHQRELRIRNMFETMPLRDDLRKETVLEIAGPVGMVRLLDSSHLLYSSGNDLVIRRFFPAGIDTTEPEVRVLHGHTATVSALAVSPDGKKIASGAEDGTLRIWDARTGALLAVSEPLDALDQPVWTMMMDICFTHKGKRILTADMYGIKEWRTRDCLLLKEEKSDIFYMRCGLVAPDGKSCCAPRIQQGYEIMDKQGALLYATEADSTPLCFSPDGSRLLAADADDGQMYSLNVRRLLKRDGTFGFTLFSGGKTPMQCASFSRDGKQLVSASADGKVYVWNAREGCLRETYDTGEGSRLSSIGFCPEGIWIVAANAADGRIHIWGPLTWMS